MRIDGEAKAASLPPQSIKLPYGDLEELAQDCAKRIVEAHGDVILGRFTDDTRQKVAAVVFWDREFAEDAVAEVIKRTVLAKGMGLAAARPSTEDLTQG
jgi:AcrR family transcriptional regulator